MIILLGCGLKTFFCRCPSFICSRECSLDLLPTGEQQSLLILDNESLVSSSSLLSLCAVALVDILGVRLPLFPEPSKSCGCDFNALSRSCKTSLRLFESI
uniref:Uncharacterized protein n=1 Tax=Medicago truncatula TaxID=3880 RepID=I3SBQ0_MEDTR|nr:unknown [Medicago truncatula]